MDLVIVESPAKAKTINKYLGSGFKVVASFGHIRDLPSKDGSVDPDNDFAMVWDMDAKAKTRIKDIAASAKTSKTVYLATDPDREGEAISWHIADVLRQQKALTNTSVQRVTFNEITRNAVQHAMANPRAIDQQLVDAYLARRALDYLVGFTLSPVLWRKLPGSRSAGRVQSVSLRLVCEREEEIERFRAEEFWSVTAHLTTTGGAPFTARLTHLDGKKLDKFTLNTGALAKQATAAVEAQAYTVAAVEEKAVQRHPYAPFITSTLQQEAARKLGFSATQTMRLAQQLYEGVDLGGETVGLITYMRTDGVQLAPEAVSACRDLIGRQFGADYLPASSRLYKSKAKNAQEAHEAIRPTDITRTPEAMARYLEPQQQSLYELIWKRTVACQMASAILDRVGVDILSNDKKITLHATGSVVRFDGFLKVYNEDRDDDDGDDEQRRLPAMKQGENTPLQKVLPEQHFTQPPPRYTEASLVKKMEELGIGRPSTYASILQVLKDRGYVRLDKKRFYAEERGRLVTTFLSSFFARYVEYNFTAGLENDLDRISDGSVAWKEVLRLFWNDFSTATTSAKNLTITEVIDTLEARLAPMLFPEGKDGHDPRQCPSCADGRLSLRLGKFGAFLGCSGYPACSYTKPFGEAVQAAGAEGAVPVTETVLGKDPATDFPIFLKKGPYGLYVQLGNADKPKRASLPKGMDASKVTLEIALRLLALPRDIGTFADTGELMTGAVGPFGPYVKCGNTFANLGKDDDVLTIGVNRASALIADARIRLKERQTILGVLPGTTTEVILQKSRFGSVILAGKSKVPVPKNVRPEDVTLDKALEWIEAAKPKKKAAGKKAAPAAGADKVGAAGRKRKSA